MGYTKPDTITISQSLTSGANLVDATTYYGGGKAADLSTSGTTRRLYHNINGHVRRIMVNVRCNSVNASAEDWTFSLTDGTTTTAIMTIGSTDQDKIFYNNNLNFKLTSGGYFQLVTTTPTWVTNPEGVILFYYMEIELA